MDIEKLLKKVLHNQYLIMSGEENIKYYGMDEKSLTLAKAIELGCYERVVEIEDNHDYEDYRNGNDVFQETWDIICMYESIWHGLYHKFNGEVPDDYKFNGFDAHHDSHISYLYLITDEKFMSRFVMKDFTKDKILREDFKNHGFGLDIEEYRIQLQKYNEFKRNKTELTYEDYLSLFKDL